MEIQRQKALAHQFRDLHRGEKALVLANVWDVASARVIEDAGFPALATSSAAVAFSLGYPDGEKIARDEMIARVARIARAVKIPVSADLEAGYGARPEDAAETARQAIAAGAVGMNLEDGTEDPAHPLAEVTLQVERIQAIREAALKTGVLLVLNARTDTHLLAVGPEEKRYDEAIRRLVAYRDAGADCVFLPGVRDEATIARAVRDAQCPLNVLAGPGSLPIASLERLGVKRVSLGSSPMRATLGLLGKMANELKATGTYSSLEGAPAHGEVNQLLA